MPLSTSYTLIDHDSTSRAFGSQGGPRDLSHIFYADSPQSDLAGRLRLRVSHETTKSGIVRSLAQIQIPKRDADGDYSSSVQLNTVLTRSSTEEIGDVHNVYTLMQYFLQTSGVQDAIVEAEV